VAAPADGGIATLFGVQKEFKGDIIVLATGFEQPKVEFLPSDLFPEGYEVYTQLCSDCLKLTFTI